MKHVRTSFALAAIYCLLWSTSSFAGPVIKTVQAGATSQTVTFKILDSTTGVPTAGLAFNSSGIDLEYWRHGTNSPTDITEATQTANGAWSSGGFVSLGHGNYRLDVPDAAVASGATAVDIQGTITGYIVVGGTIQLVAYNPQDSVRLGMTALPNATAGANGGLPTGDANARVQVQSGTGAGQISLSSGTVTVGTNNDKTGYALTQSFPTNFSSLSITGGGAVTAGTVSDKSGYSLSQTFPSNFSSMDINATGGVGLDWGNVQNATTTVGLSGTTVGTATNVTNAPTSGDLTATMKTSVQTAAAAALTSYDPPTRTEATADRDTILASIGLRTTITVTDQDTFVLASGATYNDAYNGWGVKINDAGSADEWLGKIEDYVGSSKTVELNRTAGFTIATGDTVTLYPAFLYDPTDNADLNCTVNTANFAGSTTTLACILTDTDGAAVTSASDKLTGKEIKILSGAQAREVRYVFDSTWDSGNSELQITLDRALPATLADAVTAIIR